MLVLALSHVETTHGRSAIVEVHAAGPGHLVPRIQKDLHRATHICSNDGQLQSRLGPPHFRLLVLCIVGLISCVSHGTIFAFEALGNFSWRTNRSPCYGIFDPV